MSDQHAELAAACESVGIVAYTDCKCNCCGNLYGRSSLGLRCNCRGTIEHGLCLTPLLALLEKLEGWIGETPTYREYCLTHNRALGWEAVYTFVSYRVRGPWEKNKQTARVAAAIATVKKLEGQG